MIQNEKGMSLIEVMVSMIILSLGILGMAPMVILSMESNNISQDVLEASALAKQRIEFFENAEILPALPFKALETDFVGGYERLTYMIDNTVDTTLPAGVADLQVIINWRDQSGRSRSTSYSTYIEKS